jgi:hypothetical protein
LLDIEIIILYIGNRYLFRNNNTSQGAKQMRTSKSTHYPFIRVTGAANPSFPTTTGVMTATNGVSGTAVHYVEIGGVDDVIQSIQISWPDAISSATITLQSSNFLVTTDVPLAGQAIARSDEVDGYRWADESVSITGPVAAAAGSTMIHVGNCGARRLRLKITVTANTQLYILGHGKQ